MRAGAGAAQRLAVAGTKRNSLVTRCFQESPHFARIMQNVHRCVIGVPSDDVEDGGQAGATVVIGPSPVFAVLRRAAQGPPCTAPEGKVEDDDGVGGRYAQCKVLVVGAEVAIEDPPLRADQSVLDCCPRHLRRWPGSGLPEDPVQFDGGRAPLRAKLACQRRFSRTTATEDDDAVHLRRHGIAADVGATDIRGIAPLIAEYSGSAAASALAGRGTGCLAPLECRASDPAPGRLSTMHLRRSRSDPDADHPPPSAGNRPVRRLLDPIGARQPRSHALPARCRPGPAAQPLRRAGTTSSSTGPSRSCRARR